VDWRSLAQDFCDRRRRATFVVDAEARVVVCNASVETQLGWRRDELIGRAIADLCDEDEGPRVRAHLADVGAGGSSRLRVSMRARDGAGWDLVLGLRAIGTSGDQVVLATVVSATRLPARQAANDADFDLEFDVAVRGERFGEIVSVARGRAMVPRLQVGEICYRALGHDHPCTGCPAASAAHGRSASVIRTRTNKHAVLLATAHQLDERVVRVRALRVSSGLFAGFLQARAAELAEDAALSPREREVLGYMLLGRTARDTATLLGITERTAKFHHANVLAKLGADSRHDLLRLML
jgi:PAS domain S-box-containing protein